MGGNAKTILLATVSPIIDNIDETISTMKFSNRAMKVEVTAKINEINAQDDELVKKL